LKAVRLHQPGDARNYVYEDAPDPVAGPGEVRVRVRAVALNHLEAWAAKAPPNVKYDAPRILGADVAGIVEGIGPGVTNAAPGDEVILHPGVSCGVCAHCLDGRDNDCPQYRLLGQGRDGGLAELPHDHTGRRFSALTRIDTRNVSKLKLAWQYGIDPAAASLNPATQMLPPTEAVPIVVNGILYAPTTARTFVALEGDTGREVWKHDLGSARAPTRGVTYWAGDAQNPARILAGTSDGRLIALDAASGRLIAR